MTNKLIIISSTQYPGYGGAATNAYALIKYLRNLGYKVIGIFFHVDCEKINVDPDNLGNIFIFNSIAYDKEITEVLDEDRKMINNVYGIKPSLMLCKNYKAPLFCSKLFPETPNIYLVSGISHFRLYFPKMSAQELLRDDKIEIPAMKAEIKTIESCSLVVTNSLISLQLFHKIYPKYIKKIYPYPVDTTKEIASICDSVNIDINGKIYDLIIVASVLTRNEKNNCYLINVLKDKRLAKYKKLIIGDDNSKFRDIPNSTVLNILPHKDLIDYMKKSKVLLYPSLTDANPNTVREAIYCKCLALISNNVGFYEKFPNCSICQTYNVNEWITKAIYLVDNYRKILPIYSIDFSSTEDIVSLIDKFV